MSKISEHIFGLYSQLVGDEIQPIDENVVDEAMGVINKINVTDDNSLFYFLSAINLLNAALHTNTILHGILICEVLLKLAYWPVLFSLLRSFI